VILQEKPLKESKYTVFFYILKYIAYVNKQPVLSSTAYC